MVQKAPYSIVQHSIVQCEYDRRYGEGSESGKGEKKKRRREEKKKRSKEDADKTKRNNTVLPIESTLILIFTELYLDVWNVLIFSSSSISIFIEKSLSLLLLLISSGDSENILFTFLFC